MTIVFAIVAVACLLGWGATLFAFTRGILWMVNANAVAERTDARMDVRIREIVARLAPRRAPEEADASRPGAPVVLDDAEESLREARRMAQRSGFKVPDDLRGLVEQPMDVMD